MVDDDNTLAIRVTAAPNPIAAIKCIRAATALPMGEIKTALAGRTSLMVAKLYGSDHDDNERTAIALFEALDSAGADFEVILAGQVESRQYVINAIARWRDIGTHTQMTSALDSGEPDIETLEWLQSTGTADVFQRTLRQIIDADGYNVDAKTLDWAKRQLDGA